MKAVVLEFVVVSSLLELSRGHAAAGAMQSDVIEPVDPFQRRDGDLHANGRDAFEFYTRKKVVTSQRA